jgi:arylsulfatase A-like enzyme
MSKYALLLKAISSFLIFSVCCLTGMEKPNVVIIFADDVGLGDVGRQHTERTGTAPLAPTPAIDALANEGLWFTDAHSPAALCAPSRYAVMTGNYNFRSPRPGGVWGTFDLGAISETDMTLGRVAQSAGYTTGFIGKWHMGGDFYATGTTNITRRIDDEATPEQVDMTQWIGRGPQDLGFNYDFTVACGVQGPTYTAHENGSWYPWETDSLLIYYDNPLFVSDKGPGIGDSNWDSTELNMLLADKAASFISTSAASESPFMLYYCSPAVHLPHTPPSVIDGEPIAGTTPSSHLDMNRVLDLEVKKIVDALKAAGVYENTLILFTSDNGGLFDQTAQNAGHQSSGGFRNTKNSPYEGGHRVPLIAVWPSVIEANTRTNAMVNGTDIMATIADTMGASFSDEQAKDSHSLFPLFLGDTNYEPRSEMVQQAGSQNQLMLRQGPWKLIILSTENHNFLTQADTTASELYNLDDDPGETSNLINNAAHANRATSMYNRYWEIRNASARSAPSHGTPPNESTLLLSEDFSNMTVGDSVTTNQPISNGSYDTEMRIHNNAHAEITTNPQFGNGNVLELATGTNSNPTTGGFGSLSNKDNAAAISLDVGDQLTLTFDMLVLEVPSSSNNVNIEFRTANNGTKISRIFTEYTQATPGDIVSFSWTADIDANMANETGFYFWIPIEGIASNYSSGGPNGNGTELAVMQLDNLNFTVSSANGYLKFKEEYDLNETPSGDDDGDSIPNVFEYAFGSDPKNSNSALSIDSQIVEDNGSQYMEIRYSRRKTATNHSALRVWRTTDLSNPIWELGATEVISVNDDSTVPEIENVVERSLFSTQANDKEFFIMDVIIAPHAQ